MCACAELAIKLNRKLLDTILLWTELHKRLCESATNENEHCFRRFDVTEVPSIIVPDTYIICFSSNTIVWCSSPRSISSRLPSLLIGWLQASYHSRRLLCTPTDASCNICKHRCGLHTWTDQFSTLLKAEYWMAILIPGAQTILLNFVTNKYTI